MTIRGSIRSLFGQILGAMRTRVELFGVEWQQARAQIAALVGLLLAGVAFLWLAVMMFSLLVVTLAWPTPYRNWVVIGLLLIYLVAGLVSLVLLKRRLEKVEHQPFSATVDELGKDVSLMLQAIEGPEERDASSDRQQSSRAARDEASGRRGSP